MRNAPASACEHHLVMSEASHPSRSAVVVVGAGMAGLTCAVALHAAGRPVVVLEAADGVGGRVRTDRHPDGFLLDRGFQVLLDAYPAVRRVIDLPALSAEPFDAGAVVWTGRRLVPLADPLRHPAAVLRDLTSSVFSTVDKVRLAAFAARARLTPWTSARDAAEPAMDDLSAAAALQSAGFSSEFIDNFARPFWGGILLDPSLATSAGPLRFTLKMFLEGRAVLPQTGLRGMPDQFGDRLPSGTVRTGTAVDSLVTENGRVTGVRVGGEAINASAVVVATDPPAARRLTGIDALPDAAQGIGSTTVYLTGTRDPGIGRRLVLDGTGRLTVNHVAPLSVVQPSYAPPGQHLVAAVVIGEHQADDDELIARRAHEDVAHMLRMEKDAWSVLAVYRIPFSQFAQPPGIYESLPAVTAGPAGLFLATEATVDSSYNGAILSGEAAARAVLDSSPRV